MKPFHNSFQTKYFNKQYSWIEKQIIVWFVTDESYCAYKQFMDCTMSECYKSPCSCKTKKVLNECSCKTKKVLNECAMR